MKPAKPARKPSRSTPRPGHAAVAKPSVPGAKAAAGGGPAEAIASASGDPEPPTAKQDALAVTAAVESEPGVAPEASAAPDARPAPALLIQIDPAVSGGFIHNRFDLQLRGRVASPEGLEEIELEADGRIVARAAFGQPHRAPLTTMPDGTPARHRVFQLYLPRPQSQAGHSCSCVLRARTQDGRTGEQSFGFAIDPAAPEPVMVTSGATLSALAYAGVRPHIVLYVERAVLDSDGVLSVHGWVVALTPIVTVQVFAGENERLPAAQFGGQRDDVANFYPWYPNARQSGFSMTAPIDQARSLIDIRVQAISMNGFVMEAVVPLERVVLRTAARRSAQAAPQADAARPFAPLRQEPAYKITADFHIAAQTFSLAPLAAVMEPLRAVVAPGRPLPESQPDEQREIHYYCDEAFIAPDGTLGVDGWATSAAGIAGISIYLGSDKIGEAELGTAREDVGAEHPDIPGARFAGFHFRHTFHDLAAGEHGVRIVIRNERGDIREETKAVRFQPPAAPPPPEDAPPPAADVQEFRFELDTPQVVDDCVREPVTGRLTIEGWLLARSGVASMEVFLDDQRLGEAHYGLARQDVGTAFPEWDNALRSGYAFHCPPRSLRDGTHTVRLAVRAKNGREMTRSFAIEVKKSEQEDGAGTIRRRMSRAEADALAAVLADLDYRPAFHLAMRQKGTPDLRLLATTLESLTRQAWPVWSLTVVADSDAAAIALRDAIAPLADHPIDVIGPSDATFDAPFADERATGLLFFGALCPGDELAVDALSEIAVASGLHRDADFLYADEARISPASLEREPFYKPDFSPDLLLSTNYIGRPWFAATGLMQRIAVTPHMLVRDGEYDLVLRCTERATSVRHVPGLLAQRGSVALDDDAASRAALTAAAVRRDIDADVQDGCIPGTWRFRRMTPATGKVAIIIPTCAAHGYIENCIVTLRAKTAYPDYEIVCIDNIPDSQMAWKIWLQQNADRIIDVPETFNWSRFNNLAAAATDSEYLLFLNDDIEITQEDWLDAMLEHAQRPEVGVVGPQLLYSSGKVQHAGMFLGAGIGRHAFRFAPADDPGYFGLALTQRNAIAVTGACMLMRRSFFEEMQQFDEAHSVINNDLDFCLRTHRAGKLIVYTPHASLIHHELASRERLPDVFDTSHFNSRWKSLFAAGDPYFSPLLSRHSDDYRPDDEAVQTVFAAHPLFDADEIRRILVVKLDHIGDFVTGLPAIRRLKSLFPRATLTVLAGPHARGFADMEPAIDEFLEFEFFHARSQLGERELTREDFLALRERLAPYRFDLAVDLRKHLSTRDVLKYTGARFLAGYDYMGQCPFLDIALEWDGDKPLQRKRSHIVDDLLALVEAIATACETDRALLPSAVARPEPETLPQTVRALFERPVVAMHIGAGNVTKTWPAEYFSALIDLIVERHGVGVMLVGGPDDREVSEALLQTLLHPEAAVSVAGQSKLNELPRLLSACCLYIGNDSGPKHIAAALGVPTIGIHSGVVDAAEWGPVGRRAMALRRNMACSPCYTANAADCPRGLACLRHLEPAVVYRMAEMLLPRPGASAATPKSSAVEVQDTLLHTMTAAPDDLAAGPPAGDPSGFKAEFAVASKVEDEGREALAKTVVDNVAAAAADATQPAPPAVPVAAKPKAGKRRRRVPG